MNDCQLLEEYVRTGSQRAFAELVAIHQDWIYSAALRLVRRGDWAEDVTQAVFLLLAQRAGTLNRPVLNGWLFKVTRYCAASLLRGENRRRKREKEAAMMTSTSIAPADESDWESILPRLEETVGRLRNADREAVLLRFYQGKSLAEVGEALGISENAAGKRVAHALEQLRWRLDRKGASLPAGGAAGVLLAQQITQAAPPTLAAVCMPGTAGAAGASALQIARGANQMLFALKMKWAAMAALLLALIPAGIVIALQANGGPARRAANPPAQNAPAAAAPAASNADTAITPFCNSLTQAIISVNVSIIDVDAIAEAQRRVMKAGLQPGDPQVAAIEQAADSNRRQLKAFIDAGKQAGCEYLYPIVGRVNGTNFVGFFVCPLKADTEIGVLDEYMKRPGLNTPDGKARLYNTRGQGTDNQSVLMHEMASAAPHPELLDALAAEPDTGIRIVATFDAASQTPFWQMLRLGSASDERWKPVKWLRVGATPPPFATARLLIECGDAASASGVADLLAERFAAMPSANGNPRQRHIAELVSKLKPAVVGTRVVVQFDQPAIEAVMAELVAEMSGPPRQGNGR